MWSYLTIWDAIEAGDQEMLQRYLKVREDGRTILYRHDDEDEDIDLASTMRALARFRQAVFIPENLVQYVQGDLRRMALFFVRQLIDEKVESGVTVRMMYDPEQDRLDLQVIPKSLLGALWYQCAGALMSIGAIADV